MGFEYRINKSNNFVFSQFSGAINNQQLLSSFNTIFTDPLYTPVMNQFINYAAVSDWQVNRYGIEELAKTIAKFNLLDIQWTSMIIAPDDLLYGYARMYQMLNDDRNEKIMISRSLDEALGLLSIDAKTYPFNQKKRKEQLESY